MSGARSGRLRWVLAISACVCALLLLRCAQLALGRHGELAAQARRQQTQLEPIPAVRGPLLDRHGRMLTHSVTNPSLAWEGGERAELVALARQLAQDRIICSSQAAALGQAAAERFQWIARDWIPEPVAREVARCHAAVTLREEMKRFYPLGPVAPQVLGCVGVDGDGLSGLEWECDDWLAGEAGLRLRYVTGAGRPQQTLAPRVLRAPRAGGGLLLTLDARVQEIVRHHLRVGLRSAGARCGWALVLHPRTGEILALCEEPGFDPLARDSLRLDRMRVRTVSDVFEPGSTFKIVGFTAAIESGLVAPSDTIDCCQGLRRVPGGVVRDLKELGRVTAAEALIYSSNIGNGVIAERVGWERIYRTAQAYGFGQPTGVPLGGEAAGDVPHPLRPGWSQRSLLTIAYGQEVGVTGLQMALAYAAIANDGWLPRPLLVRAMLDAEGRATETHAAQFVRRVCTPETAATLRGLLRRVVSEGTGRRADLAAMPPAGKTGTAQVYDPELGSYSPTRHVLSFVGFAPWHDPQCLIAIALDCDGPHHSGEVVAPIFRSILQDLLWLLEEGQWQAAPLAQESEPPVLVPDLRGLSPLVARRALLDLGLLPVFDGLGTRVAESVPQPYASISAGGVVELRLAGREEKTSVIVPRLEGLSLRRAVALLARAGLRCGIHGSGWVVRQEPTAGAAITPGSRCEVWGSARTSRARVHALRRDDLACQSAGAARAPAE